MSSQIHKQYKYFVVIISVENDKHTTLVSTFMQYFFLKFGIYQLVVISCGNLCVLCDISLIMYTQ